MHGKKFDYSKVKYINSTTEVEIICREHGSFFQIPSGHLSGQQCPSCSGVKQKTTLEFISESKVIHNNLYDYSKVEYINNRTKVIIICLKHGEFEQSPKSHLRGHGCPKCNISKGELKVKELLENYNIKYIREYKFEDCVSIGGRKLPFDFYIKDMNLLIEYDGRQHFEDVFGVVSFINLKQNDNIKDKYCELNNIELLRIKYDDENSGFDKLKELIWEKN